MELLSSIEARSPLFALVEHRHRAEQIVGVIVRYGLADASTISSHPMLAQLAGRVSRDPALATLSRGERLRNACQELGTTFIKIGQILSTRADLVGPDVAATLASLQDDDPADTPEQVALTVSAELGTPADDPFAPYAAFDPEPVASASVGQTHRAALATGEALAVKVRHRGVRELVDQDLSIVLALARLVEHDQHIASVMRPTQVAGELARSLRDELDFRREASNLVRMAANFADTDTYVFPAVYPKQSGEAVLTESWLDGTRLSEVIHSLGPDADDVIRAIATMYFRMIFVDGLFHADPHPGNLLLLPNGRIGVLDFGKVGRLRDGMREAFVDFLASVFAGDIEETTQAMLKVAPGPSTLDSEELARDLEAWVEQYFPGSPGLHTHTDLGPAVTELLTVVHRQGLRLPPDVSLMLIVVVQLQGLLVESGSTLTLTELLLPFAEQLRRERMSPQRLMRQAAKSARHWERLLDVLPVDLTRLVESSSRGDLRVPLSVEGIDRPVNRLAYALIATATINGAANLLSRRAAPTVRGVSVPGLIGAAASAYLAADVVRAARKAGGLA